MYRCCLHVCMKKKQESGMENIDSDITDSALFALAARIRRVHRPTAHTAQPLSPIRLKFSACPFASGTWICILICMYIEVPMAVTRAMVVYSGIYEELGYVISFLALVIQLE